MKYVYTNVNVRVRFNLEHSMKAQLGVEVQHYSLINLSTRWGGWSLPHPCHFRYGKDLVHIVHEAGWTSGLVWMGAENLASTSHQGSNPRLFIR